MNSCVDVVPHPHGWAYIDVAAPRLKMNSCFDVVPTLTGGATSIPPLRGCGLHVCHVRECQGRRPGIVVAPAVRLGKERNEKPTLSPARGDIARPPPVSQYYPSSLFDPQLSIDLP